jgi:pSer/pThr/pTyr-binding forkhead associated (FHA) protein
MPALIIKSGPQAGRRFEVASGAVIGRRGADLELDDPQVSRRHARLRLVDDGLEVDDLDSLNGTWVNQQRIRTATPLRTGDVVMVGETLLEVELERVDDHRTVAREQPLDATIARPDEPSRAPAAAPSAPGGTAGAAAPLAKTTATGARLGAFAPPAPPRRTGHRIASRRLVPAILSFLVVIATAVALLAYFLLRGA